ncbi:MAG TPA: pyridoxine 5'-phosphate synthase [Bacteroidales bacterium]|nr:pyridoxine 5'-phosphate synthase [Bacteroidales bacterium]HPT01310.1 pyridoxine 5'-phosphate synthase [Bacteroidales bacterium]
MTKLSVNINKIATIRNARGGNMPDVLKAAIDCELFGAQGITVHPRPDERHIRYSDVYEIRPLIRTEFNIEGNPQPRFINLVLDVKPHQVTLVPDAHDAITSNAGWNTIKHKDFLRDVIAAFKKEGIRTSIFVDPDVAMVKNAAETGTDRIELYTEAYARNYPVDRAEALAPYLEAAKAACEAGLGINAGHDLDLNNLWYIARSLPGLQEVSIGHALISEALYLGLEKTIGLYLQQLKE